MCDKVRCFLESSWPTTCHKVFDEDVKKGADKHEDRGRTGYPQVGVPFRGLYSVHIIDIFICLTFFSGSSAPPTHTHCRPLPRPQFTEISTLPESPNCVCIILAPFVAVQNSLEPVTCTRTKYRMYLQSEMGSFCRASPTIKVVFAPKGPGRNRLTSDPSSSWFRPVTWP